MKTWYLSIKELYRKGKYNHALSEIYQFMNEYPENAYGKYLCGMILSKTGNKEEGKKYLEQAAYTKRKIAAEARLQLGYILFEENNYDEAEKKLTEVISISKYNESYALSILAKICCKKNKYKKALDYANKIKECEATSLLAKANVYLYMGNINNVREALKKINASELSEYDLVELMYLENQCEDYEKVIETFSLTSNMNQRSETYYKALAINLLANYHLRNYDEVINKADILINSKYPLSNEEGYLLLGKAYMAKCDYDNSKMYLTKANEISNYIDEDVLQLAILEYKNKNFAQAEKYLKEYYKITEGKTPKSYFTYLNLLIEEERYEEATLLLNKAKEKQVLDNKSSRIYQMLINKYQNLPIEPTKDFTYREKQIYNYSYDAAIDHIKRHRENQSPFNENIDLEELYENTKAQLTEDNKCYGDLLEKYLIDYENIAPSKNQYIAIVVPKTKDIITMYPVYLNDFQRPKDFARVKEEYEEEKAKHKAKLYAKFYKK